MLPATVGGPHIGILLKCGLKAGKAQGLVVVRSFEPTGPGSGAAEAGNGLELLVDVEADGDGSEIGGDDEVAMGRGDDLGFAGFRGLARVREVDDDGHDVAFGGDFRHRCS